MKMLRRLLCVCAALACLASVLPSPARAYDPPVSFSDVRPSDWFYEPVRWALEEGIAAGTGGGRFEPNKKCTVAEALTFLYNFQEQPSIMPYDLPDEIDIYHYADQNDWYWHPVLWACSYLASNDGPLLNEDTDTFQVTDPCTRLQFIDFVVKIEFYRALPDITKTFRDLDPKDPRSESANIAYHAGIVAGVGNGRFDPNGTCTRAEIITFL